MAKDFKDFTYLEQKLSQLKGHYLSVDFEQNPDGNFAFAKDVDYGDVNRYRTKPNRSNSKFTDKLKFELHLVKDPDFYEQQTERIFSETDIREITRWLTSTDTASFITFDYEDSLEKIRHYYGQFVEIDSFQVHGETYGLKLSFECISPFGYSEELKNRIHCTNKSIFCTIMNNDDCLDNYCYPTLHITSDVSGQIYFCNLSDCHIYEEGNLPASSATLETLREKVLSYGLAHGYAPEFDTAVGNDTALPFSYITPDGLTLKCVVFYSTETLEYFIVQGGFLSLTVRRQLPILINTEKLFVFDELNRMIPFTELGIGDMDYMYWPRLINGENHFLFWGENCDFLMVHRETRKVGA